MTGRAVGFISTRASIRDRGEQRWRFADVLCLLFSSGYGLPNAGPGMTPGQRLRLDDLLDTYGAWTPGLARAHHGMAAGADAEFHAAVTALGLPTFGHPGVHRDGRPEDRADGLVCTNVRPECFVDERNRAIARQTDVLFVASRIRRGGQYDSDMVAAISVALDFHKPIYVMWPDGTFSNDFSAWQASRQTFPPSFRP
ncbi:hypothetical protein LuPra_03375 [Luteitalea pratensis]|uniref:Uncharacterized protein n=1 Tax=Luteitalea pratensis TaxID=1855912 RepID=A0A143PNC3_LUTPR|nr:hypothetical protein [Luteitalea pratensis]AMY10147.1 hypothetical protein LuPra_03375 [Luteitalea pratensis]